MKLTKAQFLSIGIM